MTIQAHWRMNGNSDDSSGNGYNGTTRSITYSAGDGVLNSGALFNGLTENINSSYIKSLSFPVLGTQKRTTSCLFKTSGKSSDNNYLSVEDNGISIVSTIRVLDALGDSRDHKLRVYVGNWAINAIYRDSVSTLTDSKWHHLVVTIDMSNYSIEIYIDSKPDQQTQVGSIADAVNTNSGLIIGGDGLRAFNGSIDEFMVDSEIWSVASVKNRYSQYKGFF